MTKRPDHVLFDRETQSFIYNYQQNAIQRMLDFDFAARRETPSVAAIINPSRAGFHKAFWGTKEVLLPMYKTMKEAAEKHPRVDVVVNFASFRSAYPTTVEALDLPQIRTVIIIAEGVPERKARMLAQKARSMKKTVIGPSTVGGIVAGAFKIGNTGGTLENIIDSKLHRPGSVGFVSKSGGMSNEAYNIISRNTDGIYEGIAIGGDKYPGSTLLDHLLRFEANPDIKMLVSLGEIGGKDEYEIVEALKAGRITKPLVVWVTGTCSKVFPSNVQFGHAGAKADSDAETADAKNKALKEAGAIVPSSFEDYDARIHETYESLVAKGIIVPKEPVEPPTLPMDYAAALKQGVIRKSANFITTIADDRGEELLYAGVPIGDVIEEGYGLGGVIGLLWFKKDLPDWAKKFIEMAVLITADHGAAVSGAHNCIVAARAGKDLISSVVSGMMTIGPRFGGAVAGAATSFKRARDAQMKPTEFVKHMKQKGVNIQGIGHRIKSTLNPDKRVEIMKDFAVKNFPSTNLLNYALDVERITTAKKNNLILNVDGCIGILFVDLMESCGMFTKEEVDEIIENEGLNGIFVLGRTIGMMGHFFDQKRLKQPLYRHPWDDIAYMVPEEPQRPPK